MVAYFSRMDSLCLYDTLHFLTNFIHLLILVIVVFVDFFHLRFEFFFMMSFILIYRLKTNFLLTYNRSILYEIPFVLLLIRWQFVFVLVSVMKILFDKRHKRRVGRCLLFNQLIVRSHLGYGAALEHDYSIDIGQEWQRIGHKQTSLFHNKSF